MSAATFDGDFARRRALRRAAAISATAHAAVMAVFVLGPAMRPSRVVMPSVVTVDLVAAPPAPSPRTAPRPTAPPAPRKVVLPTQAERTVAPVVPKPRPEPVEEDYDDLLARLREESGEQRPEAEDLTPPPPAPTPEPVAQPTVVAQAQPTATPLPATGGRGRVASPDVVAWVRDARMHVRREWVLAPGFRLQDLETHVEVELDADGHVVGEPEVTRRSGNPWYDESVTRAIQKADPLPRPPEAGRWPFVFRPEDY